MAENQPVSSRFGEPRTITCERARSDSALKPLRVSRDRQGRLVAYCQACGVPGARKRERVRARDYQAVTAFLCARCRDRLGFGDAQELAFGPKQAAV